jgi:quercetin dioxygenase-like cupin family protein
MKFKKANQFSKSLKDSDGFKGMTANWLWTAEDGMKHFAMRLMEFEPGGYTSFHSHLEEHQFYFLAGKPTFIDSKGDEHLLAPGDTLYCGPNEPHQIKNAGTTPMRMICMIPILPVGNGKTTTPDPNGK